MNESDTPSNPDQSPDERLSPIERVGELRRDLAETRGRYESDMPETSELDSLNNEIKALDEEIQRLKEEAWASSEHTDTTRRVELIMHRSQAQERRDLLRAGRIESIKRHPANPIEE